MLELLTDPAAWVGLLTLVVLEIVLGIDNLIFIAILTEKLPPQMRDKARLIGLSLALLMRLALLSVISWLVTLTTPLFELFGHGFSGRDLILLVGGIFLLFKATSELHERLEGATHAPGAPREYASFATVIAQIVVLDAVFSLDSVITAVGMVDNLAVMVTAVIVAMAVMLLAAKPLTLFVNRHPTVVVLCLSFLLMIGLSLIAEGLGFHLPKAYLYAAIGFSILIEFLNQWARRNSVRQQERRPLRERTAESVLRLMGGGRNGPAEAGGATSGEAQPEGEPATPTFAVEERTMVGGVLTLAGRSVRSIMTPRTDVSWIDLEEAPEAVRAQLLNTPHGMFPVCRGSLDRIVGVARAKDLLGALADGGTLDGETVRAVREPLFVPETSSVIRLIDQLRAARGQLALVTDEFGMLTGVVSPLDVLEAIVGEFPDEDEGLEIQPDGPGAWTVAGAADLHLLEQVLDMRGLAGDDKRATSVGGFVLARFERMPAVGESITEHGLVFTVAEIAGQRIRSVKVERQAEPQA